MRGAASYILPLAIATGLGLQLMLLDKSWSNSISLIFIALTALILSYPKLLNRDLICMSLVSMAYGGLAMAYFHNQGGHGLHPHHHFDHQLTFLSALVMWMCCVPACMFASYSKGSRCVTIKPNIIIHIAAGVSMLAGMVLAGLLVRQFTQQDESLYLSMLVGMGLGSGVVYGALAKQVRVGASKQGASVR